MSDDGSFNKVEKSDRRMYGERKIIVCGYPATEHLLIMAVMARAGLEDVPVVFPDESCLEKTLKDIMALEANFGKGENSKMRRSVVLSGLTEQELHNAMDSYRDIGLPGQLWAVITPTTESWTLKQLLDELAAERDAFRRRAQQNQDN
jgi:hypothetical protein